MKGWIWKDCLYLRRGRRFEGKEMFLKSLFWDWAGDDDGVGGGEKAGLVTQNGPAASCRLILYEKVV